MLFKENVIEINLRPSMKTCLHFYELQSSHSFANESDETISKQLRFSDELPDYTRLTELVEHIFFALCVLLRCPWAGLQTLLQSGIAWHTCNPISRKNKFCAVTFH